ncbi:hypothetical protein GCM10010254_62400 [Streptomyces chromofuscus]|nr:hypothetical protein GCM10010254_62400 [Streptomyces chromofuscus]
MIDEAAEWGWGLLELPARHTPRTDPEAVRAVATVVRRLLDRGGAATSERSPDPTPLTAWDDAQTPEHGPDALSCQGDLSIPPGRRVAGFPSWAPTGPRSIDCASCAAPMRLLLTAGGDEMDARPHSWVPLEDRDPSRSGTASIRGGPSIAQPTRLRFGRDHDLHVFTCPAGPGHPPPWVLA